MMGYVFIGFITLVGIGTLIYAFRENPSVSFTAIMGSILVLPITLYLIKHGDIPEPRAIDVYRNKTTLQITYQDSIPVDTVVVWKDEFKNKLK
jgi:hypothetical protein